jgi:hypothetical protein
MIFIMLLVFMNASNFLQADESFITVCKVKKNVVKLEYLDSVHGISKISQEIHGDTLVLLITVSPDIKNEGKEIVIPQRTLILKIGKRVFSINDISPCNKSLSGKEAIEMLKKH